MLTTSTPLALLTTPSDVPLSRIAGQLCAANEALLAGRRGAPGSGLQPSRLAVASLADDFRSVLFPGHFGAVDPAPAGLEASVAARLGKLQSGLREQIRRALSIVCEHPASTAAGGCGACAARAAEATDALLGRLPAIRRLLESDLRAAYASDPAATFLEETLHCYPGIEALTQHRIAHQLHALSVPLLPRMLSELAHAATGIDIHPGAEIGPHFFIDHGTGLVIGETCRIGARVRLHQGVTLGGRSADDPYGFLARGERRHPLVADDVVIYPGATVLGPVTIGEGAVIGGNVCVTDDVPAGARVTQGRPERDVFADGAGI